jgi:hypothetical protein
MTLRRISVPPCAISGKLWLVRNVEHARFAAAFAANWKVWKGATKPFDHALALGRPWVFVFVALPHLLIVFCISLVECGT